MGMDSFAPGNKRYTGFVVRNVSPQNKTINIFNYPINMGQTRDLLSIPGVAEQDIRASLLKGEVRHKFLCEDIELVFSDIDLLQFSSSQREWLTSLGFSTGTQVKYSELDGYVQNLIGSGGSFSTANIRENVIMIGSIDGYNRVFYCPNGDQFINNNNVSIVLYWNGVRQLVNNDYLVYGYNNNAIVMVNAPSPGDIITCDYYIST